MDAVRIRRALISVSDKTGLIELATVLQQVGIELVSTGGTRRFLEENQLAVTDVSAYTHFPEMMAGRVKTLHPKVFAGILCRHDHPDDMAAIGEHQILPFELVVVNLYPFNETVACPDTSTEQAIEQIDIGGPSLLRAAAKNSQFVTVCCRPEQYSAVIQEIQSRGGTSQETRSRLMLEAFRHTADYDIGIAHHFAKRIEGERFPATMYLSLRKKTDLRYGENDHLEAALYWLGDRSGNHLVNARQLHGRQLSYNNLLDLEAALNVVRTLELPSCSVIKHNNPCGAASGSTLRTACEMGFAGDPMSAFGAVIGFNRTVDAATADFLVSGDKFVEAIVAPGFDQAAQQILSTRPKWKSNVRLLAVGNLADLSHEWEFRHLTGGMLVQDADTAGDHEAGWEIVSRRGLDDELVPQLKFAWHLVRYVKSNAITICRDHSLVGVGAGQMSRVDAVEIAIRKASSRAVGSVMGSDAFFPFADSMQLAAQAGITAIIQPGGSVRDKQVIECCDQHGMAMVFTRRRHFRH